MKTRVIILASLFVLAWPAISQADSMVKVGESFSTLDFAIKRLEEVIQSATRVAQGKRQDDMQRFLNAVYLFRNNRPQDAAALFLSLIEHPELGKEATFYLSESMFASANYQVAADYYWMVVEQRWDPAFRSTAIRRLLEISIRTHSYRGIEKLVSLVEQMPDLKDSPEVNYARGKFAYHQAHEEFQKPAVERREVWAQEKFIEALRFFGRIRPQTGGDKQPVFPELFSQAVYYSGATLVHMAQVGATSFVRDGTHIQLTQVTTSLAEMREMLLFEAARRFAILASDEVTRKWLETVLALEGKTFAPFKPRNNDENEVQALARMALGRIFYELGETGEAIRWYRMISDKSAHYEDALYEMAWVYVRDEEVMKAAETLAIMEARNKNSVFLPRARLLLGYLNLRGEKWKEATEYFDGTAERYRGVHETVQKLADGEIDVQAFFDQIVRARDPGRETSGPTDAFRVRYNIPAESLPLFHENQTLMKAIILSEDISGIGKNLELARENMQMVKRRLQSASKIGLFPLLAETRQKTYEMEIRNMEARAALLKVARERFSRHLTGNVASQMKKHEKERQELEKIFSTMPKSTDSLESRMTTRRKVYDEKILQVENLAKDLQGYQQIITGLYEYYKKQSEARQRQLAPFMEQLREEAADVESALEMARQVRSQITDASLNIGVDDADMESERIVREKYRQAINGEFASWESVKSRFSPQEMAVYDRMVMLMNSAATMDTRLDVLNGKLQAMADERLEKIRQEIDFEEANLKTYELQYQQYRQESGLLNREITRESIRQVAKHFYDVVVESDLGVVDVNWSLRSKTRLEWIQLNDRNIQITTEMRQRYREVEQFEVKFDEDRMKDPFDRKEDSPDEKKKPGESKESSTGGKPK